MNDPRASADASGFYDVCALADLPDGIVRDVTVGRRPACAVRLGERVFVFGRQCPHRGGPLAQAKVTFHLSSSDPWDIAVERASPAVACPWHGWEFSLGDGRAFADPAKRMRLYDAEVRGGQVVARVGRAT